MNVLHKKENCAPCHEEHARVARRDYFLEGMQWMLLIECAVGLLYLFFR